MSKAPGPAADVDDVGADAAPVSGNAAHESAGNAAAWGGCAGGVDWAGGAKPNAAAQGSPAVGAA